MRRSCVVFCVYFVRRQFIRKVSLTTEMQGEKFFSSFKVLQEEGYLKYATNSCEEIPGRKGNRENDEEDVSCDSQLLNALQALKE